MRRKIVAGNWKMNLLSGDCENFLRMLRAQITKSECEVLVCPPFVHLDRAARTLKDSAIALGAQNCAYENAGAFTGEISPLMLEDIGCEFVLVGHSERRAMFGDNDMTVNARALKAIENGLTPIVCVGETLAERKEGKTEKVLSSQLEQSLKGLKAGSFIVAYEPVWAIGTGLTPTDQEIEQTVSFVRAQILEGERVSILYGGSLNALNAEQIFALENVDGGLIGGASLKANDFSAIVHSMDARISKNKAN